MEQKKIEEKMEFNNKKKTENKKVNKKKVTQLKNWFSIKTLL